MLSIYACATGEKIIASADESKSNQFPKMQPWANCYRTYRCIMGGCGIFADHDLEGPDRKIGIRMHRCPKCKGMLQWTGKWHLYVIEEKEKESEAADQAVAS